MNECGEQNSPVHEASCEELRQELSESLQKVRDGLNDASATSFDRLLGWMSELCAIVAKEGPSSRKVQVPLAALIQSTNELESSFNFTIGNIIRMCFVKLFIIFFRKCCVDESEKRRLLWIWELRDDDTFNEFARLVLYIGASRKGLIEELIFNMTRCLHDSARFITSEPESFVKTRESLEKISKLLLEMPSNSSPLASAFGRLFNMAINVALLDNKPIASKTREIYGGEFPEEVATAIPLPSVIKGETLDEMTENENEVKRMRLSNKDMNSLPASFYMADLHEDGDGEDEIVANLSDSPSGSQEQTCSTLCGKGGSQEEEISRIPVQIQEYARSFVVEDPYYHRLNQRLSECTLEMLMAGKQGSPILKRLQDDPSFDIADDRIGRNLLIRRIADFLLTHADIREQPSPKETRSFVAHLFARYPSCSTYASITEHWGRVECRVRRVRSLLGKRSLLSPPVREDQKRRPNREWPESSDDEAFDDYELLSMVAKHEVDGTPEELQQDEKTPTWMRKVATISAEADHADCPLNEKLSNTKLRDVLVDARGRAILEKLENDESYLLCEVDKDRCYVKRKITDYLLIYCNKQFAPANLETRAFVHKLFAEYPTVNASTFVGSNNSCLEVHLRQTQQRLKRDGFYKPRPYTKHARAGFHCVPETARDLHKVNSLPVHSAEHLDVLRRTRDSRMSFCRINGASLSFERYKILAKGEVVLADFCAAQGVTRDEFARRWISVALPKIDRLASRLLSVAWQEEVKRANYIPAHIGDHASFDGLLKLLACFPKNSDKDLGRSINIVTSFPREHTAGGAMKRLKEAGITLPVIFSYGDATPTYFVAVEGRDVTVPGDLTTALLVLLAVFSLFDMSFAPAVKAEMELVSHLLGVKDIRLTETAKRLLASLESSDE